MRPREIGEIAGHEGELRAAGAFQLGLSSACNRSAAIAQALEHRLEAGAQQRRVEGFGQVILGAQLDAADDAGHFRLRGNDDDRRRVALRV